MRGCGCGLLRGVAGGPGGEFGNAGKWCCCVVRGLLIPLRASGYRHYLQTDLCVSDCSTVYHLSYIYLKTSNNPSLFSATSSHYHILPPCLGRSTASPSNCQHSQILLSYSHYKLCRILSTQENNRKGKHTAVKRLIYLPPTPFSLSQIQKGSESTSKLSRSTSP